MPPRDALDSALPKSSTSPISKAASAERRKVLIIVENLPSPFDRRVWQEAGALRDAGYGVSIICPTGKGYEKRFESIDGIDICTAIRCRWKPKARSATP